MVRANSMNWGDPGSASFPTVAKITKEMAVVGPDTKCFEEPNSAAMIGVTIAVYKP